MTTKTVHLGFNPRGRRCWSQHLGLWAIEPRWLGGAIALVNAGQVPLRSAEPERTAQTTDEPRVEQGQIAVIEIVGQMTKEDSTLGGTNSVRVRRQIRTAGADPGVRGIMLVLDSPGGTVDGTNELAQDVAAAAAQKPLHAHIEDLGASAAFWVASQAGRVTANETALVGSIGTLAVVADLSAAAEKEGVKVHVVSTGAFKGAFVPGTEITDTQLADLQERVDDTNAFFLRAVMDGRALTQFELGAVADGRVMIAAKAREAKLIDAVESLDQAFEALLDATQERAARSSRRRRAMMARVKEQELHARIRSAAKA